MSVYCLVENGVIQTPPRPLPTDFAGVLNFNLHTEPERYGWLPVVLGTVPDYDPLTEKLVSKLTLGDGVVNQNFYKEGMTRDEVNVAYPVPKRVSAAQALVLLEEDGLLDTVEDIVKSSPRPLKIWYDRSVDWERDSPSVQALAVSLGLTDAQVDDMFRRASRKKA